MNNLEISFQEDNSPNVSNVPDEIGDSQPMSLPSFKEEDLSHPRDIDTTCDKASRPARHTGQQGDFRSVEEIDPRYRGVFSYPFFNLVQSAVIDDALYTDKSMVVCAPTGSGKTVVFEMAIVQLLMDLQDKNYTDDFKIIYMAPVKALCTERLTEWYPKFTKLGLLCIEVTGDTDVDFSQLKPYSIIITTPEKWDMLTRRWRDYRGLVEVTKLFLIDEVHILNDCSRGPVLETVVSRMKTIEASAQLAHRVEKVQRKYEGTETEDTPQKEAAAPHIRFIAVSATVSNPEDVSAWLGTAEKPAVYHKFGDECRPVKLKRVVEGYPCTEGTNIFKFDIILNYKLRAIIQRYHNGKPTLIFCNTRKSVMLTADALSKELTINLTPAQKAKLVAVASNFKNKKLQALVLNGIGCHHAGLLFEERQYIEQAFRSGDLPILITTTTLAMGVNLPAHLVIIKNTQQYVNGAYQEYSISTILQMVGRAGRPQFDTEATAVIMTRLADKHRYQSLVGGDEPLQSYLHKRLAENLNSEVALGTVSDVAQCVEWLRSTFLCVRAAKDPRRYLGLPQGAPTFQITKKIEELCVIAMNGLARSGLITMDEATCIESTEAGKLMSVYYLDLETMKHIMKIGGNEPLDRLLWVVCESHELADVYLRVDEKRSLNTLNRNNAAATIRYPMKGKISTRQMKLNCVIQAILGCLPIPDPSLNQEAMKVMRIAERVCKCMVAYVTSSNLISTQPQYFTTVVNTIVLAKCIAAHLWENSPYVSKQLKGIGATFSTLLASAGKTNFMLLEESHPRDLERIMNKGAPAGNVIRKQISFLPKYQVTATPIDNKKVKIQLTLLNQAYLADNIENLTAGGAHKCYIIAGDSENHLLMLKSFQDKDLIRIYEGCITFELTRKHSFKHKATVQCVSLSYVGIDAQCEYIFQDLEPAFARGETNMKLTEDTTLTKTNKKQSCITDTFKERKRKSNNGYIIQPKEKKKRECALIDKFNCLKSSSGIVSKEMRGLSNIAEITNSVLHEMNEPEKPTASNVIHELMSQSSEINATSNPCFGYSATETEAMGDDDNFMEDVRVDSILNEIENEISKSKHCLNGKTAKATVSTFGDELNTNKICEIKDIPTPYFGYSGTNKEAIDSTDDLMADAQIDSILNEIENEITKSKQCHNRKTENPIVSTYDNEFNTNKISVIKDISKPYFGDSRTYTEVIDSTDDLMADAQIDSILNEIENEISKSKQCQNVTTKKPTASTVDNNCLSYSINKSPGKEDTQGPFVGCSGIGSEAIDDNDDLMADAQIESILNEIEICKSNQCQNVKPRSSNLQRQYVRDSLKTVVCPKPQVSVPNKLQILRHSPNQLPELKYYQSQRKKSKKPGNKRSNYSFIDLLERNTDMSDEESTNNEDSVFSESIKYKIDQLLQNNIPNDSPSDRILSELMNTPHTQINNEAKDDSEISGSSKVTLLHRSLSKKEGTNFQELPEVNMNSDNISKQKSMTKKFDERNQALDKENKKNYGIDVGISGTENLAIADINKEKEECPSDKDVKWPTCSKQIQDFDHLGNKNDTGIHESTEVIFMHAADNQDMHYKIDNMYLQDNYRQLQELPVVPVTKNGENKEIDVGEIKKQHEIIKPKIQKSKVVDNHPNTQTKEIKETNFGSRLIDSENKELYIGNMIRQHDIIKTGRQQFQVVDIAPYKEIEKTTTINKDTVSSQNNVLKDIKNNQYDKEIQKNNKHFHSALTVFKAQKCNQQNIFCDLNKPELPLETRMPLQHQVLNYRLPVQATATKSIAVRNRINKDSGKMNPLINERTCPTSDQNALATSLYPSTTSKRIVSNVETNSDRLDIANNSNLMKISRSSRLFTPPYLKTLNTASSSRLNTLCKNSQYNRNEKYVNRYSMTKTKIDVCTRNTPEHHVKIVRRLKVDLDVTEIISKGNSTKNTNNGENPTDNEKDDVHYYDAREKCALYNSNDRKSMISYVDKSNDVTIDEIANFKYDEIIRKDDKEHGNIDIKAATTINVPPEPNQTENLQTEDKGNFEDKSEEALHRSYKSNCVEDSNESMESEIEKVIQKYSKFFLKDNNTLPVNDIETKSQDKETKILTEKIKSKPIKRPYKISEIHKLDISLPTNLIFEASTSTNRISNKDILTRIKEIDGNEMNVNEMESKELTKSEDMNVPEDCLIENLNEDIPECVSPVVDILEPTADFNVDEAMFDPKTLLQCLNKDDNGDVIPPPLSYRDNERVSPTYSDDGIDHKIYKSQNMNDNDNEFKFEHDKSIFEDCNTQTPSKEVETWTFATNDRQENNNYHFNPSSSITMIRKKYNRNERLPGQSGLSNIRTNIEQLIPRDERVHSQSGLSSRREKLEQFKFTPKHKYKSKNN